MSPLKVKIGCCGFPVSKKKYYEALSLVEINATFYKYLDQSLLEKWRKEAPENFEFTVKAHQDISHTFKLSWRKETREALKRMVETCETLEAQVLLIQTPGSLRPSKETLKEAQRFFEKAGRENLTLVWETRGPEWLKQENFEALRRLLSKVNVVHCVDPLLAEPAYTSNIAYFRLHGMGEKLYYYEYSNVELEKLKEKIGKIEGVETVYMLFNNLAMFTDAVRFKTYLETGRFPPLQDAYGVEAAWKILKNVKFPVTKANLVKRLGWRLLEVRPGRQVPLKSVLNQLPSKTYQNSEALLEDVEKILDEL
ncbi:DUF72 domain-containing protein [Candidatus Bathyarchaeota archaeon]|nr:MAG: DUF72 domain-containing protein [Candidatus Bathyarchaeota archaeon]